MDHFEESLRDQLTRLAESADPAGGRRVWRKLNGRTTGAVPAGHGPRRARHTLLMGAFGGVAAIASVFALSSTGVIGAGPGPTQAVTSSHAATSPSAHRHARQTGAANMPHLRPLGRPCPGATHAAISQLAAMSSVPIWLPKNDISKVTNSWSCGNVPVVMLGDVKISYEPGWGDVDIPAKWHALIADYGGHVTTVAGHEALVQPADAPSDSTFTIDGVPVSTKGGTRNQIMVVDHGTLVRLLSTRDVSMSRLLALAKALDFSEPVTAR